MLSPEDADKLLKVKRQVLETGRQVHLETSMVSPGGTTEYFEGSYVPKLSSRGKIDGLIGYFRNVTDRPRAEEALKESEAFTRRVLDNLFGFVGVLTPDGTLLEVNQTPLAAAGIAACDICGKKFWDVYWWNYDPQVQARVRAACERAACGVISRYDVPICTAGDSRMWVDFQIAPLRDDQCASPPDLPLATDIQNANRPKTPS